MSRMNWAWVTSLDQIWRSPTFPMWLTLAAAAFFGVIVLITLLRAEKSVANGALTVITLLAIGVAVAATIRGFGSGNTELAAEAQFTPTVAASLPALSCIDDVAGDVVLAACERSLFGSAESTAAAVSYASAQLSRLAALGDISAANGSVTPELQALRRAVERDRYGLMAYVLTARDHCTPSDCGAFRALTDRHQIATNMEERVYDGLVARYAPSWNAPPAAASASVAALVPGVPTGKPTNAEFPSSASTPPVSIMTSEPSPTAATTASRPSAPAGNAPPSSPRPVSAAAPTLAAAKKPTPPKPARAPAAPVVLTPSSQAPAASND
jgi:hypothetical protein